MSELVVTLLRLSYLALLWLLVLSAISVLRKDIFGTRVVARLTARRSRGADARDAAPAEPPHGARARPVTLAVLAGPLAGTRLSLSSSAVLIGRSPGCTLVLDDDYASGRHARIFPHDGRWLVEDLGSTNGTYLADHRIGGPEPMELGMPLRIGQTVIELQR
ncbi:FHA domain containing protein [Beutenbergia cavernae DSM 12333]|uniref:FHA domain containing protein n=1 Tax=Beutenbergia cavernae (strain ATCC BAA-8 / DSM 12333 / CCUG 43141 / JCM 11478 / NBRC 16432 / NCIMB 13614 / HKI 0122) TaxID=471853 RepID=C5BUS3_BEUC1|nr:FHA domain-containing protein [Beutenbergia cavernae]ACQ78297.1 FHA domain containing protein [Beutenbergia cavernae DSM 12333]